MADNNKWGDSFVKWKELIPLFITMIVTGGTLCGYVLTIHGAQPHTGAVSKTQVEDLKERISRQGIRCSESLRRIEEKLDRMLDK